MGVSHWDSFIYCTVYRSTESPVACVRLVLIKNCEWRFVGGSPETKVKCIYEEDPGTVREGEGAGKGLGTNCATYSAEIDGE